MDLKHVADGDQLQAACGFQDIIYVARSVLLGLAKIYR